MKTIKTVMLLCATSTIIFSGQGYCTEIDQTKTQKTHTQRQGPPPEAYTACQDKNAGDAAEFVDPKGKTMSGTCEQEGDRLVLRPDSPTTKKRNDDKHKNLPQETYTACQDKNAGDVAQYVNPKGKTISGTCKQKGDRLVLQPDSQPTKKHNGNKHQGPPPEAYTACQGKNVGDVAEFVNPKGETMSGICEQDKDRLVLRPTRSEKKSD